MNVTRRDFLAGAAATGMAFAAPVVHGAEKNKRYRTALVGTGWWGMNIFRTAIASGRVEAVAESKRSPCATWTATSWTRPPPKSQE